MANSSFTKGTIETPVPTDKGGTGLTTLGTADQVLKTNAGATAIEWGDSSGDSVVSKTAGETINGATLPVPVYQNTSDNEFYACDANVRTKYDFIGFAISNSTDGNSIDIQFSGIVEGFTGLAEGEKYYVQDTAGTIGTSKGTYQIVVGQAISTTELMIWKKPASKTVPSSNIVDGTHANVNTVSATYVKKIEYEYKEIGGKVRCKWETLGSGYTRIYVNGSPIGAEHYSAVGYISFDDDITVAYNDLIQLYVKTDGASAGARIFGIYFDKVLCTISSVENL